MNPNIFLIVIIAILLISLVVVNIFLNVLQKRVDDLEKSVAAVLDVTSDVFHTIDETLNAMIEESDEDVDESALDGYRKLLKDMLDNDDEEV